MSQSHRDYFNRLATEWETRMPAQPEFKGYIERFGVTSGESVLDIGAGTGRMTRLLRDAVGPDGCVIAQDIAFQMLIKARSHIPRSNFVCEDIHALAYSDSTFDKILCFSAFPHFTDQISALLEMARVLKSCGRLLILHNRCSSELNAFHATLCDPVNQDRLPRSQELAQMIRLTELEPIRVEEQEHLYWVEALKPL